MFMAQDPDKHTLSLSPFHSITRVLLFSIFCARDIFLPFIYIHLAPGNTLHTFYAVYTPLRVYQILV